MSGQTNNFIDCIDFFWGSENKGRPAVAHKTIHSENLVALRRIEGQIKGIQKMIENKKYCIDIATQVHASIGALHRVSEKILSKHIEHCVVEALRGKSEAEKLRKIAEIMGVMKRLRKLG